MPRRANQGDAKAESPAADDAATSRRVQMSVQVSPELRQRVRLTAVFLERELSELVEEAIAHYLGHIDRERREQGLKPVPKPEPRTG